MSEPPPAPPPESEPPYTQPQYSVPEAASSRWLGEGAPYYGFGAGMAVYLLGYGLAIAYGVSYFNRIPGDRDDESTVQLVYGGGAALANVSVTALVLITSIVLLIIPRTRAVGAGLAAALGVGAICGGGVCVALLAGGG